MKPNQDPFDQSQPLKPGYTRAPQFMDVAEYDDGLFIEYIKGDGLWESTLKLQYKTPHHRQAWFNSEHFENSMVAQRWNYFVELRKSGVDAAEARRLMNAEF